MSAALLALLPLAAQYVIPLVEKLIGGRKSPTDTQTGQQKQEIGVGLLQQIAAITNTPATNEEYKQVIDAAVSVLNASGLLPKGASPTVSGFPLNLQIPVQFTGSFQIGAQK